MEAERAYVSFSVLDLETGPEGLREPAQGEREPSALELVAHEGNVVEQTDVKLEMTSSKQDTSPEPKCRSRGNGEPVAV